MQDIKSRKLREKIQTQIPRYVLRFEPPLYVPAFTQKDFNYPLRIFHKGTSTEKLQLTIESTELQLSHLYTRGKAQSKERLQLGDLMITNNTW